MLLVHGDRDLQMERPDESELRRQMPGVRLLTLTQMNHVLRDAPEDPAANLALYDAADAPLAKGLMDAIVDFLCSCMMIGKDRS